MEMTEAPKPLTFPPEIYKRLVPEQYLAQHLASSSPIRPDARQPNEFRDLSVTTGSLSNTNGSSVVRNGDTVMVCGIRAEIIEPDAFAPKTGVVVPNIELGPLCHSTIKTGPPSSQQQSLAYQLRHALEVHNIIDLKQLCIEEGKAAWILYIDIVCLSSAGSLLSTAYTAMFTALRTTSLPSARWNADIVPNAVRCKHEYVPLVVGDSPFILEFAIFNNFVLADPSDEETSLATGIIVVKMTADGAIHGLRKVGAANIGITALDEVLELCEQRVHKISKIVNSGQRHVL